MKQIQKASVCSLGKLGACIAATVAQRQDIKLAVICCPWLQYRSVKFAPGTKVFTPWKL